MKQNNTRTIVLAALLAAFTTVATMIIKIPTPTMGYIHLGDGLVLLCGILLGPGLGAAAAGIGQEVDDHRRIAVFERMENYPAPLVRLQLTPCVRVPSPSPPSPP